VSSAGKEDITMTTTEREQLVVSLLNYVTPRIEKFARRYDLEYEDLYQDASLLILKMVDGPLEGIRDLNAVASYRVRLMALNKLTYSKRHCKAQSLDAPLSPDCEITLADLLPSPYYTDPASVLLSQERLEQLAVTVARMSGTHGIAVRSRYETALAAYC
jgi:hypothetical protein